MAEVSIERERALLEAVSRSDGEWSTRDIDFEVSRQAAPGGLTVLDELKVLEGRSFVERVERVQDAAFVGWRITPEGRERLVAMTP